MSFNIIITDDCSKDNTVLVVEKWLTINSYCFQNIEFIKNKNNKGTVYNYNYLTDRFLPKLILFQDMIKVVKDEYENNL